MRSLIKRVSMLDMDGCGLLVLGCAQPRALFVICDEGMYLCERGEMLLCTTVRSEGHVYRLASTSLLSLIPRITNLVSYV